MSYDEPFENDVYEPHKVDDGITHREEFDLRTDEMIEEDMDDPVFVGEQ